MKKLTFLVCLLLVQITFAQQVDKGPTQNAPSMQNQTLFDLEFAFDIGETGTMGDNDLAGVIFINDQFWISEWDTTAIHILNTEGELVQSITIPGISGTRSFTTDGTNLYIGTGGSTIFIVDPIAKTLTGEISITTESSASARMVAYDATLDGGNGGFWIGNFSSDIASLDMNGNELSVIPFASHGTVVYGGAVDFVTDGGPYLWIHDLSGDEPEQDFITQIDLATGEPTGVVFNFAPIGTSLGALDVNAGGLFITDQVTNGTTSLVGVCQCLPSNILFSLTLDGEILGSDDTVLSNLEMYPNPADSGLITFNTPSRSELSVSIFDMLGKKILNTTMADRTLDVSSLTSGMYIVQVKQDGVLAQRKLIIEN